MHSILYKIKSFPKRRSNRQLLADLLNEYPIDRQYHSLPNIKSPPTQKPTAKSLLIASAFHQTEDEAIIIENEVFDEIEDTANQKPIRRRPTPYAKEEDGDEEDEEDKDQHQLDMNKKEIKQLKKIVKIQKKQLDYLLARSSDGYFNPMYSYFDQDEYQYNQPYSQENYAPYQSETNHSTSHSIPIQYKKRKDDSQLSSSMPNLNDTHNEVKGSHSLPSLGNTNNSSMYNRYNSQEDIPTMSKRYSKESASSVPTMYNRYSQESASSGSIPTMYNRYSQDSGIASSVPTMYTRRYSKETYGESVTSMPIPYHHHQHQDSTYSNNNNNNNYSYNNYYSYQYPVPYYYQSNSSTSSVPNYYYPQQQQEYPSSYFYNIT